MTPCRVKWWNARLWKLSDVNWNISFLVFHFVDTSRVSSVCFPLSYVGGPGNFFYLGHLKNFYTIQYNTIWVKKVTVRQHRSYGEKVLSSSTVWSWSWLVSVMVLSVCTNLMTIWLDLWTTVFVVTTYFSFCTICSDVKSLDSVLSQDSLETHFGCLGLGLDVVVLSIS